MKLRRDFVTNSSSSSFVLTLKKNSDEILLDLLEEMVIPCYGDHVINNFIARRNELVNRLDVAIGTSSNVLEGLIKERIKYYNSMIAKVKKIIKERKKDEKKADLTLAKLMLNYEGLVIFTDEDELELRGGIHMYNGTGDIPDVICRIITYATIKNIKFKFVNKEDH